MLFRVLLKTPLLVILVFASPALPAGYKPLRLTPTPPAAKARGASSPSSGSGPSSSKKSVVKPWLAARVLPNPAIAAYLKSKTMGTGVQAKSAQPGPLAATTPANNAVSSRWSGIKSLGSGLRGSALLRGAQAPALASGRPSSSSLPSACAPAPSSSSSSSSSSSLARPGPARNTVSVRIPPQAPDSENAVCT